MKLFVGIFINVKLPFILVLSTTQFERVIMEEEYAKKMDVASFSRIQESWIVMFPLEQTIPSIVKICVFLRMLQHLISGSISGVHK
jgi:hypothetical protein